MKKKTIFTIFAIAFLLQPVFLAGQGFPGSQGFGDPFSSMDKAFSATEPPTPEDEYYLGRAVAANILTAYRPYSRNTELTLYLNRILQSLVINSSRPQIFNGYHLLILDNAGFNAFATPGGHIFITKGLVDAGPSEDALAGIIAHELGHITLRHAISLIDDMKITETASSMAQQAANLAGKGNEGAQRALAFRNSVGGVMDTMMKSGFSKPQEFEADKAALQLLATTGYDPNGLLDMLKVLERVQRNNAGGFNSTHPSPTERIANVNQQISQYRVPDTRSYRAARFRNK
jgi:predicted Zn-dependent protease